jgi:hypothetical protein
LTALHVRLGLESGLFRSDFADGSSVGISNHSCFSLISVLLNTEVLKELWITKSPIKSVYTLWILITHLNRQSYSILPLKWQMFKMPIASTKFHIHFCNASVPQLHSPFSSNT